METNYIEGDRIKAANKIEDDFNALATIVIIIEHNGEIRFGCANASFNECVKAADKLKIKAGEIYS